MIAALSALWFVLSPPRGMRDLPEPQEAAGQRRRGSVLPAARIPRGMSTVSSSANPTTKNTTSETIALR